MPAKLGPFVLLCLAGLFALPFMEMSCQGRKVMTATGYEAAFGKEMKAELPLGDLFGGRSEARERNGERFELQISQQERTQGKPLFAAALLVGVVGGALAFLRTSIGTWAGFLACILLLVAQSDVQKEIQEQDVRLLTVAFLPGFWAALASSALGAVLCLLGGRR